MSTDPGELRRPGQPSPTWNARPMLAALSNLRYGQLTVRLDNGSERVFEGSETGPDADIALHRPLDLMRRLLTRKVVGLGEAYMEQVYSTSNLGNLLELGAFNEVHVSALLNDLAPMRLWNRLVHSRRDNHPKRSRQNIAAHYDLGNDFYALWLDPTMTYSSALFEQSAGESLEAAQQRKYDQLLDMLEVRPRQHILEIGCGWGGFAETAARRGIHVTGITLSSEQLRYAEARMRRQGLDGLARFQLVDYRQVEGRFDHVVSIEMVEAVGQRYWPIYFKTLFERLKPGGRAGIQAITIDPQHFDDYCSNPDFIQLYIFPGGMLPTPSHLQAHAHAAGLQLRHERWFGQSYAITLKRWRERFDSATSAIRAMGFDERFLRMWRYYLAYCEAGFRQQRIDLTQAVFERAPG